MEYPECEHCANYFNDECILDYPCTNGEEGLSGYEPKTSDHEVDYE